jgi:RNA polymerase sigma factor for flagellar operon FliA
MLTSPPLFRTPTSEEVTRHMPLVRQVVARFLRRLPANVLRDDLVAAGVYGLIDSLRKNGGDHGPTFESYARIRIRGAILDELRTQDWLPRRARWAALGKRPSSDETPVAVIGLEDLGPGERTGSFTDDEARNPAEMLEDAQANRRLSDAVDRLPDRERVIVRMHYFQGARFKDIGEVLGVSEPRVSQLHTRAMGQLRKLLAAEEASQAA